MSHGLPISPENHHEKNDKIPQTIALIRAQPRATID